MYCKNCGRQLKDGMRFCDRCGQSVRKNKQRGQSTAKQREIEELKNERLNRKKRLAEKEAKQARTKKRKKKSGNGFIFVIVVLLIAVLSVIIGYNIFAGGGSSKKVSPSASPNAISTVSPANSPSADVSKNGYTEIKIGSVTCPYPATFHSNTTSGDEKLNLTDAFGGATMIVSQKAKMGEAKDLMAEYAETCGNVLYSRAGSDWYAITSEDNGVVNHRKCVIRSGLAVYYDFSYNADSASSKKYTEQIEYIDANFK